MSSPFSGCGFVGAFAFEQGLKEGTLDRVNIDGMTDSIRHRGPEAGEVQRRKEILLGHRRLSILDLSERGNQPMTRDHLTIVSNGEVYNFEDIRSELEQHGFTFTSHTDTEVILRAYQKWGADALHKFNGMFAFAIWDDRKKSLFLARDRIGIKPLYYYFDKNVFLFGSEVQALLRSGVIPAEINWEMVQREILINAFYQYDFNQTLVKGIFSLPFGHFMEVTQSGRVLFKKYWDLPETKREDAVNTRQLAGELRELMEDSIRLRLVSDVPVAAFLSGGMDSSVINLLASRLVKDYKLTAITIAYEGGGKDMYAGVEDRDLEYSSIISDHLKAAVEHRVIHIKPADLSIDAIDAVIDLASFSDDARYPTVAGNYRTVREQGFKVVLNGQGADEIMAGYVGLKFIINTILDVKNPGADQIRNASQYMPFPDLSTLSDELTVQGTGEYERLERYFNEFPGDMPEKAHRYMVNTELQKILKLEDFLSMRSSVECRLPFLDHRIIEWAFSMPFHLHYHEPDRCGKILLKDAFKDVLPPEILNRPKQTFPSPNQERTGKVLQELYRRFRGEIIEDDMIKRIYKKDFLGSENPEMSTGEMWFLISLWRWAETFKNFSKNQGDKNGG